MKFTNVEMEQMVVVLSKHLGRCDIIGYAAARNTRILRNELSEYFKVRDDLVVKYGERDVDDDGNPTGSVSLSVESENFPSFAEDIEKFAQIEHEPKLFKLPYEQAIGQLSGSDLLELDWMFEEVD